MGTKLPAANIALDPFPEKVSGSATGPRLYGLPSLSGQIRLISRLCVYLLQERVTRLETSDVCGNLYY